ncbi:hypothetical protein F66182_14131, partial [Fusarium sp. NRRL 66182]
MGSIKDSSSLFQPLKLGAVTLSHRVVQAPCTHFNILLLFILLTSQAAGYPGVAGIFTASQIAGWKKVTDAVHAKGGFIYCQLWHVGRATVPSFIEGKEVLGASDIPLTGKALDGNDYAATPPRPMTVDEIRGTIAEYAAAAKRSIEAGFDGVEIHAANGYLLDQFLHDNVNNRTDEYGGSVEKRSRIVLEVIEAVSKAIGAERVGIRLSPYNYFQDTRDSNPNAHWLTICEQIASLSSEIRPAYVHMIEPRFDEELD